MGLGAAGTEVVLGPLPSRVSARRGVVAAKVESRVAGLGGRPAVIVRAGRAARADDGELAGVVGELVALLALAGADVTVGR